MTDLARFLRFGLVGTAGFFVDAGVLAFGLHLLGLDPYSARVISFLCAATFTWWGNRTLTFADRAAQGSRGLAAEWAKFVSANALGGVANYGTYAALITFAPAPLNNPYVALAFGSGVGLVFNFAMSKWLVFRGAT